MTDNRRQIDVGCYRIFDQKSAMIGFVCVRRLSGGVSVPGDEMARSMLDSNELLVEHFTFIDGQRLGVAGQDQTVTLKWIDPKKEKKKYASEREAHEALRSELVDKSSSKKLVEYVSVTHPGRPVLEK